MCINFDIIQDIQKLTIFSSFCYLLSKIIFAVIRFLLNFLKKWQYKKQKSRLFNHLIIYILPYLSSNPIIEIIIIISENTNMSEADFITLKKLGSGSFGEVFKVKRISDSQQYAIKKVKINNMKQKEKKNALNQIRLLASIQHDNIISYKEAFYDQNTNNLCTIMQLAPNGDLYSKIKTKISNKEFFTEQQIWKVGLNILQGLSTLHQSKIIHRDIKPANIFFGVNDIAKLGDMNVSKCVQNGFAKTQIGTPYYASPEVWNNQQYGYQVDIWSFGCIIYEMCCLKPPFRAKNLDQLYKKILKGKYESILPRYSRKLQDAISLCLKVKNRASAKHLLEVFKKKNPQPTLTSVASSCKLIDTINSPEDWKQLRKILPKPKYQQKKTIILKKVEKKNNILDFFDKQILAEVNGCGFLRCVKSQKYLHKNPSCNDLKQKQSLSKNPSLIKLVKKNNESNEYDRVPNQQPVIKKRKFWDLFN